MTDVTTENNATNDHHDHERHHILPPYFVNPSIDHGPADGQIPAEFQRSRLNSENFQSKLLVSMAVVVKQRHPHTIARGTHAPSPVGQF